MINKQAKMHIKQLGLNKNQVDALNEYEQLLLKWQKSINLISSSTTTEIWMRHIIDSAQLFNMLDRSTPKSLVDLGSGGGFPALVIAILDKHADSNAGNLKVTCVESVQKKCAFLRDVSRRLKLGVRVENSRIEALCDQLDSESSDVNHNASRETYGLNSAHRFDYITARALANLDKLLTYSEALFAGKKHGNLSTIFFLKGQDIDKELTEATKCWHIDYELTDSQTHEMGKIIKISDFSAIS
uniref:Ribosomal RNA small subunit methyltransferase G n=1 Tax=OCS116 cluster bacterium TaxID=2030921 RepID=A0A2A4YSG2_9PROT